MKKFYLIGNLKMNLTKADLAPYFETLKAQNYKSVAGLCVPSVYLPLANEVLNGSDILYGAQNCYFQESGAFTGEISAKMIKDFNAQLVLVGHSERRSLFGETDEIVNAKTKQLLEYGFTPIVCFGETLDERNQGLEKEVVNTQIRGALENLAKEDISKIIFAYEPVWAIGTGVNATSEQAEEIIAYAKKVVADLSGNNQIIMLYGGSLKPSNAKELLSQPSIDGGLIGGASLNFEDFNAIIETADSL